MPHRILLLSFIFRYSYYLISVQKSKRYLSVTGDNKVSLIQCQVEVNPGPLGSLLLILFIFISDLQ